MGEYIDREALISKFERIGLGENSLMEKAFALGVYAVIETFPAADVAPVTHGRCDIAEGGAMERLTRPSSIAYGGYQLACIDKCDTLCHCICDELSDAVRRLGQYEDTGLTPQEIRALLRSRIDAGEVVAGK